MKRKYRLRHRSDPAGPRRVRDRRANEAPLTRHLIIGLDTRQNDDSESGLIGGYGLKWTETFDAGWFSETFRQGAFESLDDVPLLLGHNQRGLAFAMSQSDEIGGMRLDQTDEGLEFEARLNLQRNDAGDLYLAIRDRNITGMSVGFWPIEETVTHTEGEPSHYEVTRAELVELSVVLFPAYETSEVDTRLILPVPAEDVSLESERFIEKARDQLALLAI